MCYNAILPAAIVPANANNELIRLTYTFNRWLKMLTIYSKLDEARFNEDFLLMSKVIKSQNIGKDLKRAIQCCRDYALSELSHIEDLKKALTTALSQEDSQTLVR